jgi:hypothetical protein
MATQQLTPEQQQQVIDALAHYTNAHNELIEAFDATALDADIIANEYPFPICFRDLLANVIEWEASILMSFKEPKTITEYSWEKLNSYRFDIYPINLVITTPLSQPIVEKLWNEWSAMDDTKVNLDDYIKERTGAPCIASLLQVEPTYIR